MPTKAEMRLSEALKRNSQMASPDDLFAYGEGVPADADWRNLLPMVELGLAAAPGSGEAMSLADSWKASGRGAEALGEGRYADAIGDYADWATGLAGAIPGAGVVFRGTKRGAAWMDRNLPEWTNRLLDAISPSAKEASRTTRIFAGPTAKTADQAALSRAQELTRSGASRDDIWRETGWFQGADGKWRFEVDDSGAALTGAHPGARSTFTGLDHPELEAAYGRLAPVHGQYAPGLRARGEYRPQTLYIRAQGPNPEQAKSVTLHEFQHGAQEVEGFARGGSASQFKSKSELTEALQRARRNPEGYDPVTGDYDFVIESRLRHAVDDPYETYRRLAGEVEARNVQTRMNMSPAERRALPPWRTQDLPDERQIIKYR